ncbi:uncharacterized protein LOC129702395 [Leucoraja erinacea]|uniref:uncharacterized protein LOC129702395 n=1 Tax=Leucoraja erinaceus TaxID=7782 RepID=UPI00245613C3|nr:uncharacterized protein LOC129702395 [Leucoraja erinacea]
MLQQEFSSRNLKNAAPAAAKEIREIRAKCRVPLQSRKNVLLNSLGKQPTGLRKTTIEANDLKSFRNQLPRSSVSTLRGRRNSMGSFNQNELRKMGGKMDTTFTKAACSKENQLNATFSLPCSGDNDARRKSVDEVMQRHDLPSIDAASNTLLPESALSAHLPDIPIEPHNLSGLLPSFVKQECLRIAAQMSNESNYARNPRLMDNSRIDQEPVIDFSVLSCSDISPVKSPQIRYTAELPGNSLKDAGCQLIHTEVDVKLKDSFFSSMSEDECIVSGNLPYSPHNLIQFDDTTMLSDPHDLKDEDTNVSKSEGYSRNLVSLSPTCRPYLSKGDLMESNEAMVFYDTSNMLAENECTDKSVIETKTSTNSKISLSKTDLLLCKGSLPSHDNLSVPKPSFGLGNEFQTPTDQTNIVPSVSCGDLIKLNETMTLANVTFEVLKHETSYGNYLSASILSDSKMSLNVQDDVQLNGTMTAFDHNATFEKSKHEDFLGHDGKATASMSCKLILSTTTELQAAEIVAGNDCKDATFDTSKQDYDLGNEPNNATCLLPPSIGDKVELNGTITLEHKNATFDTSKHESNLGNDCSKTTPLLPPSPGEKVQLNETVIVDQKNATLDVWQLESCVGGNVSDITASSHCRLTSQVVQLNGSMTATNSEIARFESSKDGIGLEVKKTGKTTNLSSCTPSLSARDLDGLVPLSKCEGSTLISAAELRGIQSNSDSSTSNNTYAAGNLGKDDAACSVKCEGNQGNGGNINSSRGPPDLVKNPHLRNSMHNEELDAVNSEWAPGCMSTPNIAVKYSFIENPPFDYSFQTSSSTLQNDTHVAVGDCSNKQAPKGDSSSESNENKPKSSSGKAINAPLPDNQLRESKAVTAGSSKPFSNLPITRRKNGNPGATSVEHKCSGEKKSTPLSTGTSRPSCSSMGRGGRPPIQPPNLSKKSLPKPRLVPGRPSSVVGTGQRPPSNQLPSSKTSVNTKVSWVFFNCSLFMPFSDSRLVSSYCSRFWRQ